MRSLVKQTWSRTRSRRTKTGMSLSSLLPLSSSPQWSNPIFKTISPCPLHSLLAFYTLPTYFKCFPTYLPTYLPTNLPLNKNIRSITNQLLVPSWIPIAHLQYQLNLNYLQPPLLSLILGKLYLSPTTRHIKLITHISPYFLYPS